MIKFVTMNEINSLITPNTNFSLLKEIKSSQKQEDDKSGIFDFVNNKLVAVYRHNDELYLKVDTCEFKFSEIELKYKKFFKKSILSIKHENGKLEVQNRIKYGLKEFINTLTSSNPYESLADHDICFFAYEVQEKGKIDWVFGGPDYRRTVSNEE